MRNYRAMTKRLDEAAKGDKLAMITNIRLDRIDLSGLPQRIGKKVATYIGKLAALICSAEKMGKFPLPPIAVTPSRHTKTNLPPGKGIIKVPGYTLLDGNRRVLAALKVGRSVIPAYIFANTDQYTKEYPKLLERAEKVCRDTGDIPRHVQSEKVRHSDPPPSAAAQVGMSVGTMQKKG